MNTVSISAHVSLISQINLTKHGWNGGVGLEQFTVLDKYTIHTFVLHQVWSHSPNVLSPTCHVRPSNSIVSIRFKWIRFASRSLLDTSVTLKCDSAAGEPHWRGVWIVCVLDSFTPHPPPPHSSSPPPFPSLFKRDELCKKPPLGL